MAKHSSEGTQARGVQHGTGLLYIEGWNSSTNVHCQSERIYYRRLSS